MLTVLPSAAQIPPQPFDVSEDLRVVTAEGRNLVVLPSFAGASGTAQLASGGLTAQSFETPTQRIHAVSLDGDTYRAATPLAGPRSRIVFDPVRQAFAPLLPSIRVELDGGVRLDAVEAALGAVGVTVFESLGFAIVELPADLHPAEAVATCAGDCPGSPTPRCG